MNQLDPMYLMFLKNHEDLKYLKYPHYLIHLKNLTFQMNHYFPMYLKNLKYHLYPMYLKNLMYQQLQQLLKYLMYLKIHEHQMSPMCQMNLTFHYHHLRQ
jgi:hypothetical protein